MNEAQARQVVRNQFKLLDKAKGVMAASDDSLDAAIAQAAELIRTLPPAGDLFREQAWKALQPQLEAVFRRASDDLASNLYPVLADEVRAQVEFAASYINGGKLPRLTPETPQLQAAGFALGSPTSTPPWATEAVIGGQSITVTVPPEIAQAVKKVKIGKASLARTFGASVDDAGRLILGTEASGLSRFLVSEVDKRVRAGFLAGQATEDIAQNLVIDSVRRGLHLGPTAMQLKSAATSVARTGLLDMANRVHEQVWDANSDVIVAYVFDATNDARACPTCSALDGKEGKKEDIPRPPIHPQCRCQKLPVTNTELELRKSGDGLRDTPGSATELVAPEDMPFKQRKGETQREYLQRVRKASPEGVRWYSTPRNVNGKRFYQRARDLQRPGTVVDWLADPKTSRAALEQSMGGGLAGARRAEWFRAEVAKGKDPQKVYAEMLSFRGMTNRKVSPERLAKFKPVSQLPGANDIKVSPRRPISRKAAAVGGRRIPDAELLSLPVSELSSLSAADQARRRTLTAKRLAAKDAAAVAKFKGLKVGDTVQFADGGFYGRARVLRVVDRQSMEVVIEVLEDTPWDKKGTIKTVNPRQGLKKKL